VARDRQRAKQRRARREKHGGAPDLRQPTRENVPGELDHASGEVDEFEAKLIADAGGEVAPDSATAAELGEEHPEGLSDEEFAALEDDVEGVEEAFETGDQAAIAAAETEAEQAEVARRAKRPKTSPDEPTKKGGFRFIAFLRASWSELQRVQWPDRRQVGQATDVVMGFVVVAGLYLGIADAAAKWLVDRII
jgi:preprotein translocase subunit SecE